MGIHIVMVVIESWGDSESVVAVNYLVYSKTQPACTCTQSDDGETKKGFIVN